MEESSKINSKWRFYLDTLFSDYSEYPFFFNEEELSYLDGTVLKERMNE